MTQTPTVGRVVHYYGRDLRWHINMQLMPQIAPPWAKDFSGPFSATIVAVRDGQVNLRVDYPSILCGSDHVAEIKENVGMGSDSPPCATKPGNWIWPPRVP